MMKRLYRSKSEVMLAGVCGGLAEYIGVDVTAVRLAFLLLLFVGLGGFWLYVILWIIMPTAPTPGEQIIEVAAPAAPAKRAASKEKKEEKPTDAAQ